MNENKDDIPSDDLPVNCVIHGVEQYSACRECFSGTCEDCIHRAERELSPVMCNFLRPRVNVSF